MERLTMRVDNGLEEIYFYNPDDPEGEYTLSDIAKNGHDDICDQIANRLAAYEDTGLTPEEVHRLKAKYEALESDKNVIASSHINAEMNLEAQQQEIKLLNMEIAELRESNQALKDYAENADADKDEQARRIMQYDTVLRRAREALDSARGYTQYSADIRAKEAIESIEALLGGKEDA